MKKILENLSKCGADFRGVPFWAWNSKIDADEAVRQINIMHEMGLGGFFIHARVGLDTYYLGKEWFDIIRRCIAEAEKLDMNVWLYDEDRWPSGAAGGEVTRDPQFRIQALVMRKDVCEVPENAVFAGRFAVTERNDGDPVDWERLPDAHCAGEGELLFYAKQADPETWYNNNTYLDTLSKAAVERFVTVTHEKYYAELGEHFGKRIKGIFTDEPNYKTALFSENAHTVKDGKNPPPPPVLLPWTRELPARFAEKYGYDIMEHLPDLFLEKNGDEFSKVRVDYYNLLTELFTGAMGATLDKWCREHDLILTGHLHWEDTLLLQRRQVGATMRFYEFMEAPGIDLLTEHRSIYDTVKQCVSVAAQMGRKWRLSECYGCTGWDFPFAGHKAIGDWQYALGINLRCQHLAWYSMAGEAKRDYPASIFFQSPWYKQYKAVEDYFARLGAVLTEGREQREILVIHPIESTWAYKDDSRLTQAEIDAEDRILTDLRNRLLALNLDFDYGDEALMSRYAEIRDDRRLQIGEMSYSTVVIPPLRTIRASTLDILENFCKAGGKVIYTADAPPSRVDGVKDGRAEKVFAGFEKATLANIADVIGESARLLSIKDADGMEIDQTLSIIRRGEDFQTLFISNVGHKLNDFHQDYEPGVLERKDEFEKIRIELTSDGEGEIVELDLNNGRFYPVESSFENGKRVFYSSLPQLGSRLFMESSEKLPLSERPQDMENVKITSLSENEWSIKRDEPNVLVLDHACCLKDGEVFKENEFIITVDAELRDYLNVPRRGGAMVQPYLQTDRTPEKCCDVELRYRFAVDAVPAEGCFLAVEHPELYDIVLNGTALEKTVCGHWVDQVLEKLFIPAAMLKTGENELVLKSRFHKYHPGLEAIFLLGEFCVKDDVVTELCDKLSVGDYGKQGFPYFAGNMEYRKSFHVDEARGNKRVWLKFGDWRGCALGVSVNGSEIKLVPWPPYQLDITDQLCDGDNEVCITVYGHRRNAFGPFYLNEASPSWVGPAQFKAYLQNKRQLVPCGLLTAPEICF